MVFRLLKEEKYFRRSQINHKKIIYHKLTRVYTHANTRTHTHTSIENQFLFYLWPHLIRIVDDRSPSEIFCHISLHAIRMWGQNWHTHTHTQRTPYIDLLYYYRYYIMIYVEEHKKIPYSITECLMPAYVWNQYYIKTKNKYNVNKI